MFSTALTRSSSAVSSDESFIRTHLPKAIIGLLQQRIGSDLSKWLRPPEQRRLAHPKKQAGKYTRVYALGESDYKTITLFKRMIKTFDGEGIQIDTHEMTTLGAIESAILDTPYSYTFFRGILLSNSEWKNALPYYQLILEVLPLEGWDLFSSRLICQIKKEEQFFHSPVVQDILTLNRTFYQAKEIHNRRLLINAIDFPSLSHRDAKDWYSSYEDQRRPQREKQLRAAFALHGYSKRYLLDSLEESANLNKDIAAIVTEYTLEKPLPYDQYAGALQ